MLVACEGVGYMTPGQPFEGDMQHWSVPLNQRSFGYIPSSTGPDEMS
jgi:hypothetical protein